MKLRSLLVATLSTVLVVSFAGAKPNPAVAPATASAPAASNASSPVASPKPSAAATNDGKATAQPSGHRPKKYKRKK